MGLRDYYRYVVDANPDNHLYESVVATVHSMLREGALTPGTRLPSLRSLMQRLEISLSTGVRAYNALVEEGVVEVRPKSGYYVAAPRVQLLPKPRPAHLPLTGLEPEEVTAHCRSAMADEPEHLVPRELLPLKAMRQALGRAVAVGENEPVEMPPPAGLPELRTIIANHVDPTRKHIDGEHVAVVSGWVGALNVALGTIDRKHGVIAVESPTMPSVLALIADAGYNVIEVPSDPVTGLCMDALVHLASTTDIDALICTPTYGIPSGSVMSGQARAELLTLIETANLPVIELNLFGELGGNDPNLSSLVSSDGSANVIHCGGFCQSLCPGYRIGWIASAKPLDDLLGNVKSSIDLRVWEAPALNQRSVMEYFSQRSYERHLLELRRGLQFQFACVRKVIEDTFPAGTRATAADGSAAMWVQLPHGMDESQVMSVLEEIPGAEEKLPFRVIPGSAFSVKNAYRNYICLALKRQWSPDVERLTIAFGTHLGAYRKARLQTSSGRLDRTDHTVAPTETWLGDGGHPDS